MSKRKTNEEFINELQIKNPNLISLDPYINWNTKIKFKCKIDNYIFSSIPNNILRGHGCPQCGKNICRETGRISRTKIENLLINRKPNLSKCLKYSDDAYKYSFCCKKELKFICPDCNFEFKKSPSSILDDYLTCPNCIKRAKYPNRFMKNVLTQLNINFIDEYSPEWIGLKKYDFYFVINNTQYIIEMDGGFHRYETSKTNDKYKDNIAIEHGINVIRIDCDYRNTKNRYKHIKDNIINSNISTILNLSKVDFDKADIFGFQNECKEVCDLWNKYHDLDIVKEKTKFTLYTIKKHLDFGNKNNMCSFNRKECNDIRRNSTIKNGTFARSIQVKCIETGEYFPNMKIPSDKYKCNVPSYFYNNGTYSGILEDGTKLHWEKVSYEDFLEYLITNKEAS